MIQMGLKTEFFAGVLMPRRGCTRKHEPRKSPGLVFSMLEKEGTVFTFLPHLNRSGLTGASALHWDMHRRKC